MIRCPFCKYTSDDCSACNGFGWFIPDDPADSFLDDFCEYEHTIAPKQVSLEKAIRQNPFQALFTLADWFNSTSEELSKITGSYVFYRDIAGLLVECQGYVQQLDRYERAISGENEPSCLMTMWEESRQ